MKPRGILMIEHRLIEKVLSLIGKEVEHIDENGTVDQYFAQSVFDFIRTYADRTHHGEELAKMLDDFHAFDHNMIHEKYNRLYESLSTAMSKMKKMLTNTGSDFVKVYEVV